MRRGTPATDARRTASWEDKSPERLPRQANIDAGNAWVAVCAESCGTEHARPRDQALGPASQPLTRPAGRPVGSQTGQAARAARQQRR